MENIIFKDGEDYYINLYDLNFAFDVVERKFALSVDGEYELFDLLDGTPIEKKDGKFVGSFEKYRWFVLKIKNQ